MSIVQAVLVEDSTSTSSQYPLQDFVDTLALLFKLTLNKILSTLNIYLNTPYLLVKIQTWKFLYYIQQIALKPA